MKAHQAGYWRLAMLLFLALAGWGRLSRLGAQVSTEIVRGKITGDDGKPIPDVSVTITGLTTQASLTARTTEKGIFTALFPNAEGDYLINVRKIGFAPFNTRATRTGLSSVLVVDVVLHEMAFKLDTIRVADRALRTDSTGSIGGVSQDLLQGALFSLDPTDLIALASQIPGILGDSTGYSVLGSGADANNATLDGARFGGSALPQDAIAGSRVIQTSADPRIGGFSGGQTATVLRGGSDIFAATARGNFSDHHLAWTDPTWFSPIARVGTFSGSVGGPIVKRKLHYQASWNINDRQSDVYSLLDPPQSIISQYGLARDTITAVSNTLSALGVPVSATGFSPDQQGRTYNGVLVMDWTPKSTTALRITANRNWGNFGSPGRAPFSYPTLGSHNANAFQFVSAKLTGYVHGFMDELNSTLNYTHFNNDPFVTMPSANVRVGTVFDDGHTGLTSLQFGGGSGVSHNTGYDLDTENEFSWISPNSKHRLKFGQEIEYEWNTSFSADNYYGSYSYQTLSDLAANRPASFARTLSTFERSSKGATGAAWIGEEWSESKALQFQGGLRYDGAYPGTTPSYNPAVDQLFGIKTDRIPHSWFITPRVGFSWASAKRRGMGSPTGQNGPIALSDLPPGLPPEFLQRLLGTPRGSVAPGWAVSGGIGLYGSPLSNGNISSLIDQTGLPNTRRVLTCVGDATPIPLWSNLSTPPESCADGTGATSFSANAPSVQAYDPSFRVPFSWRSNLGIDGIRLPKKWTLSITTFYNYGTHGQSAVDLNLVHTPQFTLANEGNRPVYVRPDEIVPATGAIAPNAYRINPDYSSVRNVISDLHNYTAQFQASIAPPRPLFHGKVNLGITYVYNYSRREQRAVGGGGGGGFGQVFFIGGNGAGSFTNFGSSSLTAGDPTVKSWVPGNQPTHQIVSNISMRAWWFNLSTRLTIYSGTPFSPTVSGDVNGDGSNDDLAYIPNPATTSDPALAAQMNQLLATAPAGARECLLKQMGRVAGINSCTSQWQARLDLRLDWQPPRSFGFGDRLRLTTQFQNTSGALVRLFGLENTPLGRGAYSQSVTGQLLYVTGFDPVTNSYKYQVNQLFGQPSNFGNARRQYPPFQVQLGLEYKLGGPPSAPMARSLGLIPGGKEPPYTNDQIRDKLQRLARDPVQVILQRKDSMALSKDQVTQLEAISREFRARSDSALEPVFDYVLRKGRHIDDNQLQSRLSKAQPQIQRMLLDADKRARALLTPAQLRMLPAPTPPGARPAPGGVAPAGAAPAGAVPMQIRIGGPD